MLNVRHPPNFVELAAVAADSELLVVFLRDDALGPCSASGRRSVSIGLAFVRRWFSITAMVGKGKIGAQGPGLADPLGVGLGATLSPRVC